MTRAEAPVFLTVSAHGDEVDPEAQGARRGGAKLARDRVLRHTTPLDAVRGWLDELLSRRV
jgi:hypothetical protein